jgi:hypothetical protein
MRGGDVAAMVEPGLDRREWQTEREALEPELEAAPTETLPALDDLVGRMLAGHGYALDDEVALEGEERDVVAEYLAAHAVTKLAERNETPDPGDVAAAVKGYRAIYEYLIDEIGP